MTHNKTFYFNKLTENFLLYNLPSTKSCMRVVVPILTVECHHIIVRVYLIASISVTL